MCIGFLQVLQRGFPVDTSTGQMVKGPGKVYDKVSNAQSPAFD